MRNSHEFLVSGGIGYAFVAGSPADWGSKLAFSVATAVLVRVLTWGLQAAWAKLRKAPTPPLD